VSNKRNRRRAGQRTRSEASRKPVRAAKAASALIAAQPAERARKERQRYWTKPTKTERRTRELQIRRWRNRTKRPRREDLNPAKRRRVYGNTFWRHNDDV
jgi:hypothetical protein